MPFYSYKCLICGTTKDVLARISDPAPTCLHEGSEQPAEPVPMQKQLTTPAFQVGGKGAYSSGMKC